MFHGEERLITIPGYCLAAREWGSPDGLPVIALHGWMDNASSFSFLAPLLPNLHIIAIDSPGCGHSSHRVPNSIPSYTDEIFIILQAATALGWETFSLLGHSKGGCTAQLIAAASPERIKSLLTIDSVGMPSVDPKDAAKYLRLSVDSVLIAGPQKAPSVFQEVKEAAQLKMRAGGMSYESAYALAERNTRKVEGGYVWAFDPLELSFAFPIRYTEEVVRGILSGIEMPTCFIIPEEGIYKGSALADSRISCVPNVKVHRVPGGHYVHMDSPETISQTIHEFFEATWKN